MYPHFKDGVFTSNREALAALAREDINLAAKVIVLAKRQSNSTVTNSPPAAPNGDTATPPANGQTTPPANPTPEETTPYVTMATSSFQSVVTSNGQRSTFTTFTVVVETVTPSVQPSLELASTQSSNPSLQSVGVRIAHPTALLLLLAMSFGIGWLWIYL